MPKVDDILKLAADLKGVLRDDQVERIKKIAGNLSDEQSDKLHAKLEELQKTHIENMKHEIDVRQRMNAAFKAYNAHKKTDKLHEEEAKEQAAADAEAEHLLEELNNL